MDKIQNDIHTSNEQSCQKAQQAPCKYPILQRHLHDTFPGKRSVSLRLIILDTRAESVCQKPALLGTIPHVDLESYQNKYNK